MPDTPTDEAARRTRIRAAYAAMAAEQARHEAAEDAAQAAIMRQQRALDAERPSAELRASLGLPA